jgi:SAM-dependent methyltransferase
MKTLRFNTIKLLNEQKQQKIYKSMHKNAKHDYESVGWLSTERQKLRFEKLLDGLELRDTKILDFGCGLGALCGFLDEKGIKCDYSGIDIVDSFVKKASLDYPKASFAKASILDIEDSFDYVFSSGTYAFCSKELFFEYAKKSFELARCEYRFNMLLNARSSGYLRLSESELKKVLSQIGGKSTFQYGYLENDITVCISKM